jgi:hypothetical protein
MIGIVGTVRNVRDVGAARKKALISVNSRDQGP